MSAVSNTLSATAFGACLPYEMSTRSSSGGRASIESGTTPTDLPRSWKGRGDRLAGDLPGGYTCRCPLNSEGMRMRRIEELPDKLRNLAKPLAAETRRHLGLS